MKTIPAFFALSLLPALAGEHVVEVSPFETTLSVDAKFLPEKVTLLKVTPEEWSTFKISSLVSHGSAVKTGATVIECETLDYQRNLTEKEAAAKSRKIGLAKAKRELADLEITTPRKLTKARIDFERKKEALEHYKKISRALQEKQIRERLDSSKRRLEYVEEELKQLLKMYEEDGVTEETEEIILKRQRSAVKSAKIALERTEASTKWSLEKTIPQEAADKETDFENAKLKLETAELNLPRELEQKKLSVAKASREDGIADKALADLKKDSSFLKLTAPADGTIIHGAIKDGKWSAGPTSKFLFESGKLPAEKPFMTFVPDGSPVSLNAFVGQKERLQLKSGLKGEATVEGLDEKTFTVSLNAIDTYPGADSKYHVNFSVTLPKDSPIVTGMKSKVKIVTYRNDKAITVPSAAVSTDQGKTTVKVKLADGKGEPREVTLGRKNDGKTEILSGLEAGQVVILPEKEKE